MQRDVKTNERAANMLRRFPDGPSCRSSRAQLINTLNTRIRTTRRVTRNIDSVHAAGFRTNVMCKHRFAFVRRFVHVHTVTEPSFRGFIFLCSVFDNFWYFYNFSTVQFHADIRRTRRPRFHEDLLYSLLWRGNADFVARFWFSALKNETDFEIDLKHRPRKPRNQHSYRYRCSYTWANKYPINRK